MEFKIVQKQAFTVMGCSRLIPYGEGHTQCPAFWDDHYRSGRGQTVCGMFGICFDEGIEGNQFKYMIADPYNPALEIPEGFETVTLPAMTWAVFPCRGPMPAVLQQTNDRIFSEWLPENGEYEIAAGCNIEYYTNVHQYPKRGHDENYYCELWIPVKKK